MTIAEFVAEAIRQVVAGIDIARAEGVRAGMPDAIEFEVPAVGDAGLVVMPYLTDGEDAARLRFCVPVAAIPEPIGSAFATSDEERS